MATRDHGDRIITEQYPFGVPGGDLTDDTIAALAAAENQTFKAAGRYRPALRPVVRRRCRADAAHAGQARAFPVATGGFLGWVHHLDAAAATVAALEAGRPGQAYNIVDDLPATWEQVFTAMAAAFGAPPLAAFRAG